MNTYVQSDLRTQGAIGVQKLDKSSATNQVKAVFESVSRLLSSVAQGIGDSQQRRAEEAPYFGGL